MSTCSDEAQEGEWLNYYTGEQVDLSAKRALIITTSHGVLNAPGETSGDPTGVFGSEMTEPYYEFMAGGMQVGIASITSPPAPVAMSEKDSKRRTDIRSASQPPGK